MRLDGLTANDLALEKLVSRIILGPSVSSPLAIKSVHRMLERVGKGVLMGLVKASTTPFRAT
jgi:hypothetical protein